MINQVFVFWEGLAPQFRGGKLEPAAVTLWVGRGRRQKSHSFAANSRDESGLGCVAAREGAPIDRINSLIEQRCALMVCRLAALLPWASLEF